MGAYACHPVQGSEPTVGWNRAVESARFGEVHVITHDEGNREIVHRTARDRGIENLYFHFIEHTPFEERLMALPGGYYPGYRRWQRRAYQFARDAHRRKPFDLAHQVNLCGYREPGELWKLDVPFVWGPVGGTQNTPTAFFGSGSLGVRLREGIRGVLNEVQLHHSRRVRRAAEAADVILAANSTAQRDFKRALGLDLPQLLETGVREVGTAKRWADRAPGPLRVLWAGELIRRKGFRLMLHAVRESRRTGGPEVQLIVVGDGPERALIEAADRVDYRGWIPREDLLALYAEADALAFTSLRDTSGNVMLEGLAAGLPVVYLDHQGAADMGSAQCGIPVPVTTPEETIAGVADGLATLATHPARYAALSAGAIARAHQLDWRVNGDAVNRIYADLLAAHAGDETAHVGDGARRGHDPIWMPTHAPSTRHLV